MAVTPERWQGYLGRVLSSLDPLMGRAPDEDRTRWGLPGSFLFLTSCEHSLVGNEMQIDRKDNEPACGWWGSL